MSRSEHLKLNLQIKCSAFYKNGELYINGNLTKISLEQSRYAEVLNEIKEKEIIKKENPTKKINLIPKDKLYISSYPTKAQDVSNNIVGILANNNEKKIKKKKFNM